MIRPASTRLTSRSRAQQGVNPWRGFVILTHAQTNVLLTSGGGGGGGGSHEIGDTFNTDGLTVSGLLSAGYDFLIHSPVWADESSFYSWSDPNFYYNPIPIYVGPNATYVDPATGMIWDGVTVPIAFAIAGFSGTFRPQFFDIEITGVPSGGGGGSGNEVADSATDLDVIAGDLMDLGARYCAAQIPVPCPGTYRVLAANRTITTECTPDLAGLQGNTSARHSLLWPMRTGDTWNIGRASKAWDPSMGPFADALGPCWVIIEHAGPWVPSHPGFPGS